MINIDRGMALGAVATLVGAGTAATVMASPKTAPTQMLQRRNIAAVGFGAGLVTAAAGVLVGGILNGHGSALGRQVAIASGAIGSAMALGSIAGQVTAGIHDLPPMEPFPDLGWFDFSHANDGSHRKVG